MGAVRLRRGKSGTARRPSLQWIDMRCRNAKIAARFLEGRPPSRPGFRRRAGDWMVHAARGSGATQPRHLAVPGKHIADGPKGAASKLPAWRATQFGGVRARQCPSLHISIRGGRGKNAPGAAPWSWVLPSLEQV